MIEKVIKVIEELANKKDVMDNYGEDGKDKDGDFFEPYSIYGGNLDDAFYGGQSSGEIQLARQLMDILKPDWKKEKEG
jgi:hypothetical protein